MARIDVKVGDDDDYVFENGDFVLWVSDQQHIQDIIRSFTGAWKEFIFCGVGIQYYLGGSGLEQQMARDMRIQITNDGYKVNSIKQIDSNFYIDAV